MYSSFIFHVIKNCIMLVCWYKQTNLLEIDCVTNHKLVLKRTHSQLTYYYHFKLIFRRYYAKINNCTKMYGYNAANGQFSINGLVYNITVIIHYCSDVH